MSWLVRNHRTRYERITSIPVLKGYTLVSSDKYWEQAIDFSTGREVHPLFTIENVDIYLNEFNRTLQDKRGDLVWKRNNKVLDTTKLGKKNV